MRIPLGWQTDLAVLRLGGSEIADRGDHLVVRTPANPSFYWGNFVLALGGADEPARWLDVFEKAFPGTAHRSIGLVDAPASVETWAATWAEHGFDLEYDDVLTADLVDGVAGSLGVRPLPAGYVVRALTSDADWEASTALCVAEHPEDEEFERAAARRRRSMAEAGHTAWFGAFETPGSSTGSSSGPSSGSSAGSSSGPSSGTAFAGARPALVLAAELGIVDVGDGVARYQSVLTHAEHRRRGLTGHLLGVAAAWARGRGCTRTVIVADAGSDGDRLYRAVGFEPGDRGWRAIRRPGG